MHIIISIFGILAILLIAFAFSENKKKINYRTILGALSIQILFAFIVLYIPAGKVGLEAAAKFINSGLEAGKVGLAFVFGPLANGSIGFVFGISVLGMIIFSASLISVLYYLKIMPFIINTLGYGVHKLLKTSKAESLSAVANIFVGQTEAPLVVKPFIDKMTRSELFAVMVGGLASVSGAILAGYVSIGIDLKLLLAACFMAAPAGLIMAKILVPEVEENTDTPHINEIIVNDKSNNPVNIVDAMAQGALSGLQLVLNVGAMLIAVIALVSLTDGILGWAGGLFGYSSLSLKLIFGYAFAPIAFILGVPWNEAIIVGSFLGEKIILNEFVAFISLAEKMKDLSYHSQVISTFALCGFANISSIGILVGGLGSIAPSKRNLIAKLGFKAVLGGTLANLLSAALAGLLTSL